MRLFSTLTAAVALVGCAPGDASDFEYRATFSTQTRGIVLHDDGDAGHAGMYGTNCPFETKNGTVTGDYDLPDEGEEIQDSETTELGEITVIALIPGTVHVLDKTGGSYTHVPIDAPGATEARLVRDGIVTLAADCSVRHVGLDGVERHAERLPWACDRAGVEVDPVGGLGLVATPEGSALIDAAGSQLLDVTGDLVAWDAVARVFYVATRGQPGVTAVEPDGRVRWSVDTSGPVGALDDAGNRGMAAVALGRDDSRGGLALHDGENGDLLKTGTTPSVASDLSVSGDGLVIALIRPEQSFFFDIL